MISFQINDQRLINQSTQLKIKLKKPINMPNWAQKIKNKHNICPKMAELWPKNICSYMGITPSLAHNFVKYRYFQHIFLG